MHKEVNQFNQTKKYLFNSELPTNIKELTSYLESFGQNINLLQYHLPEVKSILTLPSKILIFIKLNKASIVNLDYKVYYHTLQNEFRFEPYLKSLSGENIAQ